MIIPVLTAVLGQLTAAQATTDNQLNSWLQENQVELKQNIDRLNVIRSLDYDHALIVYDQCLARAAASLGNVPEDDVFNRAHTMCLPLRVELLSGRPPQWFLGFGNLDAAKRASFPALTKRLRARLGAQAAAPTDTR